MEDMEQWYKIGLIVVGFIGGVIYGIRQIVRMWKRSKANKSEELFTHINTKVWEILTEIRLRGNASRVSLTQFHNGGKYANGASMRRMSITHQSCDQKISSTMQFRQDALASRFVEMVEMLQDNDPCIRMVAEENDGNAKRFFEIHDTVAFSILPIQCSDSLVVHGYITVEWCDLGSLDKQEDEADFLEAVEDARSQIAFLLNTSKDAR